MTRDVPGASITQHVVLAFAGVTLATNAVVLAEGGLRALSLALLGLVCVVALVIWRRPDALRVPPLPDAATDPLYASRRDQGPLPPRISVGFVALAVAAVACHAYGSSLGAYMVLGTLAAAAMAIGSLRTRPGLDPPRTEPHARVVVGVLCIACALATLFAQRSDADDAFYLNLVVAAVDAPGRALLSGDTLHGLPGVAMSLPVFRVLSYEMFEAVLSRTLGVDALTLVHVVLPPLVALLIPLAYARLLGLLLPGRWLEALIVVVLVLLIDGNGRAGYADFALLRLYQGKAILLHFALPLIVSYAIEFGLAPGLGRWLRLAGAQIAAVGLSSTALWLAPLCAGIGVVCALPMRRGGDGRGGIGASLGIGSLGALTALYPIGWALALRAETARAFDTAPNRIESLDWPGDRLVEHATDVVFGAGTFEQLVLFCLIAVLAVAPGLLLRRYAAVCLLALFGLLWNPWTAHFVANTIAGPDTYFRVLWAVPVPVFLAAVLTAPLGGIKSGNASSGARKRVMRALPTILLAAGVLVAVADPFTLSAANGVRLAAPGPRVPPEELAAANAIRALVRERGHVLAPAKISRWLPLFHDHPYPLMVRDMYLDLLHEHVGLEEVERRRTLTRLVGGEFRVKHGGALLEAAIRDYPLEVVCLAGPALGWPELRRVLIDSPLVRHSRTTDHEIWSRAEPEARAAP